MWFKREFEKSTRMLLGALALTLSSGFLSNCGNLPVNYKYFTLTNFNNWKAIDPGSDGIGSDPDGYMGAVYDGTYMYFVPNHNGTASSCEFLRYDTTSLFFEVPATSFKAYRPCTAGVGTNAMGYSGGAFDGRYVYFAPYDATKSAGQVMRLDTQGTFDGAAAWSVYNVTTAGITTHTGGYWGAVFDGTRYVYFVPYFDTAYYGEVLRYDTNGAFTTAGSWSKFDPGANGVGIDPDGFSGAVVTDSAIYFIPRYNGTNYSAEFLKYDTAQSFTAAGSWTAFRPGTTAAYVGGAFDGTYIYFAPERNAAGAIGQVLRLDTTGTFNAAGSWTTFDPSANGVSTTAVGYRGVVFDGQYVVFVPYYNATAYHGEVLQYDTSESFSAADSWLAYNPSAYGIGTSAKGYVGAGFDGKYIYFSPFQNPAGKHGEILRYRAKTPANVPETVRGGSFL